MRKKNAQAWSIDMIIAVVIFVLMISVLYTVLNREARVDLIDLQVDANNGISRLSDKEAETCNFLDGQTVNVTQLEACFNQDPDTIRQQLGIENKFCLYLEDKEGRVIYISDRPGAGDNELIIGPTPCGQTI